MPFAPIENGELYYEEHGSGEPLLLVAGLGGVGAYWKAQLAHFSSRYRVILHDHRGCGRSTRSEITYTVDQMTADLVALMDHLKIERAHLVGHSTGGAIGQTLAIDRPHRVNRMVLYATWTRSDEFMRRAMETRKALLLGPGVEAYIRATPIFLYPDWWINEDPQRVRQLDEMTLGVFPSVSIASSRAQAVIDFDRKSQLGSISCPTLVTCARDDFLTPKYFSDELAQLIPGARLHIFDGGGHCASQLFADEFNRVVGDFLRG
jgi:aminoacrylate hydrolase